MAKTKGASVPDGEHPLALMESLLGAADEVEGWGAGLEAAIMRKSAAKLREMYEALGPFSPTAVAELEKHTKPIGDGSVHEITDLDGFLTALRDAIGPTLDEHREVWEREKPAAMARAEGLGITLDGIGGNCPVQAEGSFDDKRFYFRARWDEWSVDVWPDSAAERYEKLPFGDEEWSIERDYVAGPFVAGWMHKHEAVGFICDAVIEYRAQKDHPHD